MNTEITVQTVAILDAIAQMDEDAQARAARAVSQAKKSLAMDWDWDAHASAARAAMYATGIFHARRALVALGVVDA